MKKGREYEYSLGSWMTLGNPSIAELASKLEFDWLLFDLEHGLLSIDNILPNLYAIKNSKTKMFVRVPQLDKGLIARLLDWGVDGIMLPHVSNEDIARECITYINYPPKGVRGFSKSARIYEYGLNKPDGIRRKDDHIFIAQIEDFDGVVNADKIASINEVSILFVGPSDLRLNLSVRKDSIFSFEEALRKVGEAAISKNKQAGILIKNIDEIHTYSQFGFSCFAIGSDLGILRDGYQSIFKYLYDKDKI